jgi:hypothetical protein
MYKCLRLYILWLKKTRWVLAGEYDPVPNILDQYIGGTKKLVVCFSRVLFGFFCTLTDYGMFRQVFVRSLCVEPWRIWPISFWTKTTKSNLEIQFLRTTEVPQIMPEKPMPSSWVICHMNSEGRTCLPIDNTEHTQYVNTQ